MRKGRTGRDRDDWFQRHGKTAWERSGSMRAGVKAKRERAEVVKRSGPVRRYTADEIAAFAAARAVDAVRARRAVLLGCAYTTAASREVEALDEVEELLFELLERLVKVASYAANEVE